MAKHRNSSGSNKKSRGVGNMSLRKHRSSGKPKPNKMARILMAKERNEEDSDRRARKKRFRPAMHDSVHALFNDKERQ